MTHYSPPNIILTGFMGTGKTAVGREVAARLGRPFVDLDDLIVQRAGKSIPEIFAQDGEPAFRALEAAICGEMAAPAGLVIATGGGAVVNPANREALAAGGTVICLEADLDTILQRVGRGDDRPMLAGPDRVARIRELLAARARGLCRAAASPGQDPPDHPSHGRARAWGSRRGCRRADTC